MIIDRLVEDVFEDEYFNRLYTKASRLLAADIFREDKEVFSLTNKEFADLLRFADILSNSNKSEARNKSYQIITLLNSSYTRTPHYKTFAHSVLAKLGNFPGIEYLRSRNNNNSELLFDRDVEKILKVFRQSVPESHGLVFTDSQFDLYNRLSQSNVFSFSGPTSMGKSFIIKSFIRRSLANPIQENIAVMVPTRALINQFSIDFHQELKSALEEYNYKVITNSSINEASGKKNNYLLVLTPERLMSYLSQKSNPEIGYLFVDEAHKIAAKKDTRAITAYTAVAKTLNLFPNVRLYFSSPNVSNPEVFLKLFNKDVRKSYHTTEAPVAQNLFFLDFLEKKVTHILEDKNSYDFKTDLLENAKDINEVIKAIGNNDYNIIYCSSRLQTVDRAVEFYESMADYPDSESREIRRAISQIKSYIHPEYYLADFLRKRIAYHFGNLPQIIRNKVEALFKQSEINFVFCTSTLLEGVNLPARNIFILNDKIGRNQSFEPIDFWNLAGRAGRLKKELSGNIFCLRDNPKMWLDRKILDNKNNIVLEPAVESYIDTKLKKIERILNENSQINETETIREILEYIANIIRIDTLEIDQSNYQSAIIRKLINENKETIIELAKRRNEGLIVPLEVLQNTQSVNVNIQNDVYLLLKQQLADGIEIRFPQEVNYENCKEWLYKLYELFNWQKEEKKIFKSKSQLDYYAMLMNKWINDTPLSLIISQSISYYTENNRDIHIGFDEQV